MSHNQKNEDNSQKENEDKNGLLNRVFEDLEDGRKQYDATRKEAEKKINNGARLTDHRINL